MVSPLCPFNGPGGLHNLTGPVAHGIDAGGPLLFITRQVIAVSVIAQNGDMFPPFPVDLRPDFPLRPPGQLDQIPEVQAVFLPVAEKIRNFTLTAGAVRGKLRFGSGVRP